MCCCVQQKINSGLLAWLLQLFFYAPKFKAVGYKTRIYFECAYVQNTRWYLNTGNLLSLQTAHINDVTNLLSQNGGIRVRVQRDFQTLIWSSSDRQNVRVFFIRSSYLQNPRCVVGSFPL